MLHLWDCACDAQSKWYSMGEINVRLVQRLNEPTFMGVRVGCPYTFGHIEYVHVNLILWSTSWSNKFQFTCRREHHGWWPRAWRAYIHRKTASGTFTGECEGSVPSPSHLHELILEADLKKHWMWFGSQLSHHLLKYLLKRKYGHYTNNFSNPLVQD